MYFGCLSGDRAFFVEWRRDGGRSAAAVFELVNDCVFGDKRRLVWVSGLSGGEASTGLGFFVMLFIVLTPACAMIAILSAMSGFSPPPILGVLLGTDFLAITALEEEVQRETIWLYLWNIGGVDCVWGGLGAGEESQSGQNSL